MDIMYRMDFTTKDGKKLFSFNSPFAIKKTQKFLEDGIVYKVTNITKRQGSDYVDLGTLSKRQLFNLIITVEPISDFTGSTREITTGMELQLLHRVYYLENLVNNLIRPRDQNMYG